MTVEKYLQVQSTTKFNMVNEVKENLSSEREIIEIRLRTLSEYFKASESGFKIYQREIEVNGVLRKYSFIKVSFDDLMTLQGK